MPIVPLYGHADLRARLAESAARGTLPASLLLHGPRGVGKQRLALWLGQLLLCRAAPGAPAEPCGACQPCRYAQELAHPDLHWFFPRPRLKEADADAENVRADYVDAICDRVAAHGLYPAPSGSEGIFVSTVRALLRSAALAPALGRRKVFIIGDAERLVSQEGADIAANAFLKLLEEPLADTQLILTSSEPGALLPTIRSRVVCVRVPRLSEEDVSAFLVDPAVAATLQAEEIPAELDERVQLAAGAPGTLFGMASKTEAAAEAQRLLAVATGRDSAARFQAVLSRGPSGARGPFSDTLSALTVLLHRRSGEALRHKDERLALGSCRAIEAVERARERAHGNVNPQLLAARLLRELREHLS